MNRTEFESKLSDYVRGELSAAEARQIEIYLAEHPEAADDLEAVRSVLELSADIGTAEPPDMLFAAARANALETIRAEEKDERKTQHVAFWQRLPRPVYLSGLAAMLAGVVFGVLWQGTTSAWAEVVAEVRKLNSVRVEGWIRGEKGEQVPVKQWLKSPHSFRSDSRHRRGTARCRGDRRENADVRRWTISGMGKTSTRKMRGPYTSSPSN